MGTSGDSHRSCGRETDSLQHVAAATDCRRDTISPNTLKQRPETERRFLHYKKNLHYKPEGADLETLRRQRKETEMHKLCETVRCNTGGGLANRVMHLGISYRWENRLTS